MLPLERLFGYLGSEVCILERNRKRVHRGRLCGFDAHMNLVYGQDGMLSLIRGDCVGGVFAVDSRDSGKSARDDNPGKPARDEAAE